MIRCALDKDIKEIAKLLKQVHGVHAANRNDIFKLDSRKYTDQDLFDILADKSKIVFVYTDNDDLVIAYIICFIKETKNNNSLSDRLVLYIDDLCVDERYRNKGIGKSLYTHAKEYAIKAGFDSIELNVWSFNTAAMHFYEGLGLKPLKTIMEDRLK